MNVQWDGWSAASTFAFMSAGVDEWTASRWADGGWGLGSRVVEWLEVGVTDPLAARFCEEAGYGPDLAPTMCWHAGVRVDDLTEEVRAASDGSLPSAILCACYVQAGVPAAGALPWAQTGADPSVAAGWHEAGFGSDEAGEWMFAGFDPDEAAGKAAYGLGPWDPMPGDEDGSYTDSDM